VLRHEKDLLYLQVWMLAVTAIIVTTNGCLEDKTSIAPKNEKSFCHILFALFAACHIMACVLHTCRPHPTYYPDINPDIPRGRNVLLLHHNESEK